VFVRGGRYIVKNGESGFN